MNKLNVGVIMGGKGIEREVSFNSGRTICDHLDTSRYNVIPLFQTICGALYILPWRFLHRGKTSDFEHRLKNQAECISWDNLKNRIDFMYIATHGRYAEDGTLQGFLEVLNIPYLGSKVFSSAVNMDKGMQKKLMQQHGIAVARDLLLTPHEVQMYTAQPALLATALQERALNFPCIVKPTQEGSSLGMSSAHTLEELVIAINSACTVDVHHAQTVLIEEQLTGMEFSCIILTDYTTGKLLPLPPTEVVIEKDSHFFDYEQKYMPGRASKYTPARCTQDQIAAIQQTCMATMRALEIANFARIDGFLTPDNRVVIIDPNTLSGMGPSSFIFRQAAEINMGHAQLINHVIETELHAYGMLDAILQREESERITMNTNKLRIAVLFGGDSNEKEVSLDSGRNVVYKLSPHKYTVLPIFVSQEMELFHINNQLLVRNSTKEITQGLTPAMRVQWNDLPAIADFVFIALHGGKGENGAVQGTLQMLGIPYNGSGVTTSALCMNKYTTNRFLEAQGFAVPAGCLIAHEQWQANAPAAIASIMNALTFPLIVKPHNDGCSVLVSKVHNPTELHNALTQLFAVGKTDGLVEECIIGMELTVGVMGNDTPQALPPSQAITNKDVLSMEEKFLPGAGENQTPAPLPAHALQLVQKTMEDVYRAVGCKGYTRIDCFYQTPEQSSTGQERVVILELNTLPALTPATCIFHQAAEVGIKPMDFIDTIITLGLEEHTATTTLQAEREQTL